MNRLYGTYIPSRAITITTANIQDLDSIKTTIATVASAVTYSGAALNGDDVDASNVAYPLHAHKTQTGEMAVAMYPTATAASHANSYVDGSTVTFIGEYGGKAATSIATVVGTDGNATFVGASPLDSVSSIAVEAQADTGGAWTFGFQDVGPSKDRDFLNSPLLVRATNAGNIALQDADGHINVTPFLAGETQLVASHRVNYTNTSVTSFTLYI